MSTRPIRSPITIWLLAVSYQIEEFEERPLEDGWSYFHVGYGEGIGVILVHRKSDGSLCGTHSEPVPLEDLEPLTLRVFACAFCGSRGCVRSGQWYRV